MKAVAMCSLVAAIAATAQGSIVSFYSVPEYSGPGYYDGTIEYVCPGSKETVGTLTVVINNTTAVADGGWLTGFAFDIYPSVTLALNAGPSGWGIMSNVNGTGFGQPYDWGAGVGGKFNGVPNNQVSLGIAAGSSETFTFSVAGDTKTLCTLTSTDFFDESKDYGMVARFMKFNHGNDFGDNEDEGNAKIPATVPAPGAMALLALAGVASRRRTR